MAGVPLTQAEWDSLTPDFPLLAAQPATCRKTGEATLTGGPGAMYNCIAWSVGVTDRWIEPPQPRAAFEAFYQALGFDVLPAGSDEATVDGWALDDGTMTHASRWDGTNWSSKIGRNIRMTHPRMILEGPLYGRVVVSFKPRPTPPGTGTGTGTGTASLTVPVVERDATMAAEVTDLTARTVHSFRALADDFEQRYSAWQQIWTGDTFISSSRSTVFATGPEWEALVALGPAILPQVVNKLQSDNVFACNLYNQLQTDPKKKVDPTDLMQYWILDNQAQEIITLYGSQMHEFNDHVTEWKATQRAAQNSGSSRDFTTGPGYDALRAMGKPAIPLIMDRYAQEQNGWWHELLHDIMYGSKSGAASFDSVALYRSWSDWFQGKAPAPP